MAMLSMKPSLTQQLAKPASSLVRKAAVKTDLLVALITTWSLLSHRTVSSLSSQSIHSPRMSEWTGLLTNSMLKEVKLRLLTESLEF